MFGGYKYNDRYCEWHAWQDLSFNWVDSVWFGLHRHILSKAPSLHMYISCLNIHLQTRRSTLLEKEPMMEGKKGHNIDNYYERGKRDRKEWINWIHSLMRRTSIDLDWRQRRRYDELRHRSVQGEDDVDECRHSWHSYHLAQLQTKERKDTAEAEKRAETQLSQTLYLRRTVRAPALTIQHKIRCKAERGEDIIQGE